MYKSLILLLLSTAAQANETIGTADVQQALESAKNNGCFSCHATADKVVGPSFASVAARYGGTPDAAAGLAQSIRYGSKGKWGRIPMPAHAAISNEDLDRLTRWVLTITP